MQPGAQNFALARILAVPMCSNGFSHATDLTLKARILGRGIRSRGALRDEAAKNRTLCARFDCAKRCKVFCSGGAALRAKRVKREFTKQIRMPLCVTCSLVKAASLLLPQIARSAICAPAAA